ncbi:MAG: serine/threonine-protein kinase [Planctomycetota bacterium]|nr:serine/threonine-protein kinase [Planctomycetota bacterium]
MDALHRPSFVKCIVASGLLTSDELALAQQELVDGTPQPPDFGAVNGTAHTEAGGAAHPAFNHRTDEQALAAHLIATNKLSVYQTRQLLAGHSKLTLGPYRIVDSIGQGGMGQVFRAVHTVLGRSVAIKVLPREKSTPESIANFMREIRAQAQFDHPNLVRAVDAGHDGNVYFLVVEYVPGADLRRYVRDRGPLGMGEAATIISQAAEGLKHAHEQGLIHRDVKPANLLVTPAGHTKVSDLGLSGWLKDAAQDSRSNKIVGTADYLAPEQIMDPSSVGPVSDIYSLGCTLYYAVTGKVPFPGGGPREKAFRHCSDTPLHPRVLNPSLSEAFVDVMASLLEKNPALRCPTAADVILRLAPWAGESVSSPLDAETARRLRTEAFDSGSSSSPLQVAAPYTSDNELHFSERVVNTTPASSNDFPFLADPNAYAQTVTEEDLESLIRQADLHERPPMQNSTLTLRECATSRRTPSYVYALIAVGFLLAMLLGMAIVRTFQ